MTHLMFLHCESDPLANDAARRNLWIIAYGMGTQIHDDGH